MAINSPKETLYVHRLNEKVKKPELKRSLYALFSTYGRIVNIRAAKTSNLRGQAFIEFVDVGSATIAMQRLNGFIFYDLPLVIEYARYNSKSNQSTEGQSAADQSSLATEGVASLSIFNTVHSTATVTTEADVSAKSSTEEPEDLPAAKRPKTEQTVNPTPDSDDQEEEEEESSGEENE
ncbi:hypothetical protein H4R33_000670 [Dimargaris cristalligena]|nr:hypothetical protein H4R33_000670 [Dimargaris cristalligena]